MPMPAAALEMHAVARSNNALAQALLPMQGTALQSRCRAVTSVATLHAAARMPVQGEALTLCRRRWRLRLQRIGGLRHVGDSTLPGLGFSASFPCTRLPAGRNALQA